MAFAKRLERAGLSGRRVITAALLAGVAVGLSTAAMLGLVRGWADGAHIARIAVIYGCGMALAVAMAALAVALALPHLGVRWRAALTGLVAVPGTLVITAGLLVLEYRSYYAQWHEPFPTRTWFWQQFYTAAGAAYQYAVMGTRYYGLLALVMIAFASWWANRQAH